MALHLGSGKDGSVLWEALAGKARQPYWADMSGLQAPYPEVVPPRSGWQSSLFFFFPPRI